jgi:hypothetical protein
VRYWAWIACGLVACSTGTNSGSEETADTIFLGGPILTMDGASDGGNMQVAMAGATW